MPAKSEKQKKFFGAVMGAKKGQKGSSPEAKKVAKEMPKKEIKKFLKTEDNEEDEQDYPRAFKKGETSEIKKQSLRDLRAKAKNKGKSFDPKMLKKTKEEDEQSVVKQMKKGGGKAAFEGPKVKERKHFAPATKVETPKKGKGSYDRKKQKNLFESNTIANFLEAIMTKDHAKAHECLKDALNRKIQKRIEVEINTPLF